jgi:hypothetical protein
MQHLQYSIKHAIEEKCNLQNIAAGKECTNPGSTLPRLEENSEWV